MPRMRTARDAALLVLICAHALGCGDDDGAVSDAAVDSGFDADVTPRDAGPDAGPLCDPTGVTLPTPLVCNGHAELCTRSYADVSFAMAHNAMNSEEESWSAPNQTIRLWAQLELGIRGFMLDTYESRGETVLCHGTCALGRRPFVDALRDLRLFLDCHPTEVVTLILEAHIDEATTARAFEEAGLMPYLDEQPVGSDVWPTLGEMISSGRRLVVFTESADVTLPWHHEAYAFMWDTNYAATTPADFSCDVLRGSRANRLFLMNHFLTAPIASLSLAEMVNHDPLLLDRARGCQTETGFLPNFVALDFVDVGDLLPTIEALNGFSGAPAACDPIDMPTPNDGLSEAPGVGGCPPGMVGVAGACMDRFEASLVLVDATGPIASWSPFHDPGTNRVAAVSLAGAVPQGYISGTRAAAACAESGKRLCTDVEWLLACRGAADRTYPYGATRVDGLCNDARAVHPAIERFGTSADWIWSRLGDACINQLPSSLAATGSHADCVTPEGIFDLMGNLHEWTADPAGTFRGGFYVDTRLNGEGCLYATTAHDASYSDYSTGFRCCADL